MMNAECRMKAEGICLNVPRHYRGSPRDLNSGAKGLYSARFSFLILHSAFIILHFLSPPSIAQSNGGTGQGLDKLDEQQVLAQLASHGLTTLLNRDFANFKIPEGERDQMTTYITLRQLGSPAGLSISGRRALAVSVAKGMDGLLPKFTDPGQLFEQANQLFSNGVVPEVTELEYFGENPVAQSQLKPVAQTARKMYSRVAELADDKIARLSNTITDKNKDTVLPNLRALGETKLYGIYSSNMATYALCISLPKTDPARKTDAEETIKYLKDFDTPTSTIQPTVRLQIGKMQLAEGSDPDAKDTFDTLIDAKDVNPKPDITQQNTARYFAIVAEISSRKLKDAEADINNLETWELDNYLPKLGNPADQASVRAALSMLKFRLYSAQSDLTNDVDEKKKKNDQAIAVLAQLVAEQPALKDLVYDQLIGRILDEPDLTTLNPFVLQALEQQGVDEVVKPPDEKADEKKLTRAIAAAREIINRKGQPGTAGAAGIDEAAVTRAMYFTAYAHERLNHDKEAAAAFMDFAQQFPHDSAKANDAMDHATLHMGNLRKKDRAGGEADPDTRALYDRFLPLAINPPFNRKQFAFQYAAILQVERKFKEAVHYFGMVPESDRQYPQAQYWTMISLTGELSDASLTGDNRRAVVTQVLASVAVIDNLLAGAKNEAEKKKYADWVVTSDEIAADLTRRELKDPAGSLKILDGFETRIANATDADEAHSQALDLRIESFMDLGRVDDATNALKTLMAANADQGQKLMFGVIKTIEHDMDSARAAGNTADLKRLAQDRAQLTGFVVSWAQTNKDPKEQAKLSNYQCYDADSKREAAELIDEPAARKSGLDAAFKEYQSLLAKDPDNLTAQLGLGLCAYSMGNYQQAVDSLAPLMDNSKVLRPTEEVTTGTETTEREDPQYWEANYKRLKSLVELYKHNPNDPASQKDLTAANSYLGSLYIINGKKTGGSSYRDEFEKLKQEIGGLVKK